MRYFSILHLLLFNSFHKPSTFRDSEASFFAHASLVATQQSSELLWDLFHLTSQTPLRKADTESSCVETVFLLFLLTVHSIANGFLHGSPSTRTLFTVLSFAICFIYFFLCYYYLLFCFIYLFIFRLGFYCNNWSIQEMCWSLKAPERQFFLYKGTEVLDVWKKRLSCVGKNH